MSHLRQVSEIFDANGIEDVLLAPLAERLASDLVQDDASPVNGNLWRVRAVSQPESSGALAGITHAVVPVRACEA